MRVIGAQEIVAIRTLELKEVCKYWHLFQKLEYVDPLLGEEDLLIVARRGRPRNTPEDGIMVIAGTVIRRPCR